MAANDPLRDYSDTLDAIRNSLDTPAPGSRVDVSRVPFGGLFQWLEGLGRGGAGQGQGFGRRRGGSWLDLIPGGRERLAQRYAQQYPQFATQLQQLYPNAFPGARTLADTQVSVTPTPGPTPPVSRPPSVFSPLQKAQIARTQMPWRRAEFGEKANLPGSEDALRLGPLLRVGTSTSGRPIYNRTPIGGERSQMRGPPRSPPLSPLSAWNQEQYDLARAAQPGTDFQRPDDQFGEVMGWRWGTPQYRTPRQQTLNPANPLGLPNI